jgi:predicted nucleotidyltransferase
LPPNGETIRQALKSLIATFGSGSIRYAIIGGIATIQHTRVRTTNDIDALLDVSQIAMPKLFEALKAGGFSVELPGNMLEFSRDGITTIQFGDVLIDLMRPILPVYAHVLERAVSTEILGQNVRISAAEGLIVMKLIAFRPLDESDIRDLLAAYGDRLDLNYIRSEFATVADKSDPRWAKLESWTAQKPGL